MSQKNILETGNSYGLNTGFKPSVSESPSVPCYADLEAKYNELKNIARALATEADMYAEGEGDRMALDDAVGRVYTITGI